MTTTSADFVLGKDVPMEALPFSERKQDALLGYLMLKEGVFRACQHRLQPGWFAHPHNQIIMTAMLAHAERYGRPPRAAEVLEGPSVKPEDAQTRERLRERVKQCLQATTVIGLDVIEGELTYWLRVRLFQQTVQSALAPYRAQDGDAAWQKLEDGVKASRDIRFTPDEIWDFGAYAQHFEETEAELSDALTTGSAMLDHAINPEAKQGALLRGDVTYFVAPANTGKTRCMITLVRHNLKRGKKILYITHEGRHKQIESLMFQSLLSVVPDRLITPRDLMALYRSEAGRKVIDHTVGIIRAQLEYMPINRAGMTVEDVGAAIMRRQDRWAAEHGGEGFDGIVDDYPGKLRPKHQYAERRHDQDIVSDYFVQLAIELDLPFVGAYQTNREGSKAMHGRSREGAKRLMTMEDVEESWGPAKNVANIITINRDATAMARKVTIFNVAKNRTGETGIAVVCGGDYGACVTHDDAFGATAYRGTANLADVADTMLEQYPNQVVPAGVLTKPAE